MPSERRTGCCSPWPLCCKTGEWERTRCWCERRWWHLHECKKKKHVFTRMRMASTNLFSWADKQLFRSALAKKCRAFILHSLFFTFLYTWFPFYWETLNICSSKLLFVPSWPSYVLADHSRPICVDPPGGTGAHSEGDGWHFPDLTQLGSPLNTHTHNTHMHTHIHDTDAEKLCNDTKKCSLTGPGRLHFTHSSVCHSSSARRRYPPKCSFKLVVHYITKDNRLTCNCDTAQWRDGVLTSHRQILANVCSLWNIWEKMLYNGSLKVLGRTLLTAGYFMNILFKACWCVMLIFAGFCSCAFYILGGLVVGRWSRVWIGREQLLRAGSVPAQAACVCVCADMHVC